MALDLLANLVRQAAVDTGVAQALRFNPDALRSRLGLSASHVTALKSADVFPLPATPLKRAATLQAATAATVPPNEADGSLLPPEGVGPAPVGDVQTPGANRVPGPQKTPQHAPVPRSVHPSPRTPGPAVPGIRPTGHGHPPGKRPGPGPIVRQPSGPGQVTQPAPGQTQTTGTTPCPSTPQGIQETNLFGTNGLESIIAAASHGDGGCNCGCCLSTVAIVASVASTAQAAITAIAAIAKLSNES